MTGKDIKRAYDSVNPTPAEKERMLRAILGKAEVKQETGARKEPVVYTAKPVQTSARHMLPLIAACFAVLVLTGVFLFRLAGHPAGPLSTEPSVMESAYDDALQLYRRALSEGWTSEMCTEKGISSRTPIANEYDGLYYAFSDLDGNGTEELILTQDLWDGGRTEFLDIYTLKDGVPFLLASDREFLRPMLYEGGIVMNSDPVQINTDARNYSGFYRMEGEIFVMEAAVYQTEDGQWYMWSGENLTAEKITQERAGEIAAEYMPAKLTFHALTGKENPDTRADSSNYDAVLAKYECALKEGWTEEQCEIEDISTIFTAVEFAKANIGYQLLDLDGNGADELLIGDRQYIYDLYSMLEDGAPIHLASYEGNAYHYSLCQNNKIVLQFIGKEESEWTAFRLEGYQMVAEQMLICENNAWSRLSDERKWTPIEQKTAFEIMDQYPEKKLEPAYFADVPDHLRDGDETVERYTIVLEKYKTALMEKWTGAQCETADISVNIPDSLPDLGWCIQDLDGNGIGELIVADSTQLYDLYTLIPEDGGPGHILSARETTQYHLCEDGIIELHEYYADGKAWSWLELDGMDLVQKDMMKYSTGSQYSYGPDQDNLTSVSKDEAGDLVNRYRKAELDLTLFTEAQEKSVADRKVYQQVLNLYGRAVSESWTPGKCAENGISLMTGYRGDLFDSLGVAFMDLDDNGTEELLITDGHYIFDLYTIVDDEEFGPVQLLMGTERNTYSLMEGNVIYNSGSGGAALSFYTYYILEGRELVLQEGYLFDGNAAPNTPWYYYDGTNRGDPCPDMEANSIVNFGYTPLEIPFTPIED